MTDETEKRVIFWPIENAYVATVKPDGSYGEAAPLGEARVMQFESPADGELIETFPLIAQATGSATFTPNGEQAKFWRRLFRKQSFRERYSGTMDNQTDHTINVRLPGMKRPATLSPGQEIWLMVEHRRWSVLPDYRIERKRRRAAMAKKRKNGRG